MPNEKPFDTEEWLNSKKKGISGKVPRADFLAKMKEMGEEIENSAKQIEKLKQEKTELASQNKELDGKLKTSQTDLTSRDQIIKEKDKEIESLKISSEQSEQKIKESEKKEQELTAKLENRAKEIENLQQNQEKHRPEDLKPENLPADWEKELADKKDLEKENKEMEGQLKAVYHTYPIIMEEEKPENVKKYIGELEQRPTINELQQAIQQEAEKYKDYVKLSIQEQEAINNYSAIKTELEEAKKKLSEPSGPVLNEAEQRKLQAYETLRTELEQLKVVQSNLKPKETENSAKQSEEIIKKVGELFITTITPLKLEIENSVKQITELLKNQSSPNSTELPSDYENLKTSKEKLLRILKFLNLKLGAKIN
ncbi:MAG: hypothetical protein I3273_05055 [Candidatus Moeniiplasma glomeromycotorum]|nr:hypothetical protein [Candidatus Moeniiplasma glomeromycotorum]MCE8167911.1 hypothetical protein [Candidatus Moeniiplasma glomeromycotorum]MCE8169461.1 hypothetical protein [Candidatus Moeniiplasma glomeromycotorum]